MRGKRAKRISGAYNRSVVFIQQGVFWGVFGGVFCEVLSPNSRYLIIVQNPYVTWAADVWVADANELKGTGEMMLPFVGGSDCPGDKAEALGSDMVVSTQTVKAQRAKSSEIKINGSTNVRESIETQKPLRV